MTEPAGTRGRIVMLVDNSIVFDSRVQKQAESAADCGWDVVLLGKPRHKRDAGTWAIGRAKARTISVPPIMSRRSHEIRRGLFRSPFAYPQGKLAEYRTQQIKAWKADIRVRMAALSTRQGPIARLSRAKLAVSLVFAKIAGRWVSFRVAQLAALQLHRKEMDRPFEKFMTRWWQLTMGDRSWRKLDPGAWDWELAFGPVIDKLKPDLIHANDQRMLAVGARAATRAKAKGRDVKLVWDAHEFLPGTKPKPSDLRWHPAQIALERNFAPFADAVVTVSERLADLLVSEHGLTERPAIVLNAPVLADKATDNSFLDVRAQCGLPADTPLMVYSGGVAPQRGLNVIIESLPALKGVHLALIVSSAEDPNLLALPDRADELGVRDRVHVEPYVPVADIVRFLSTADVGAIPIHHWPNHEIALITKFFEYSHARLPILVSDVETMATMVQKTGQGEVFRVGDVSGFVEATKALLADKDRYVRAYDAPGLLEAWTWELQAEELERVYSRLLPGR